MAQTTASGTQKKSTPRWYDQLFFIRRRPHLRALTLDWDRPDDDTYQRLIHDDGFISTKYFDEGDISQHPVIARDADDLAEYLLPTYFEFSQKAKFYQDRFYFYQWIFVFGAFLTTVFGAIATLLYIPPGLTAAATQAAQAAQNANTVDWQRLMSVLTALVGAITAFFTAVSNRGEPQKRWGKDRRLTEELRMHYFTYLSHLPPYQTDDRLKTLRRNIVDIRVKEQQNA